MIKLLYTSLPVAAFFWILIGLPTIPSAAQDSAAQDSAAQDSAAQDIVTDSLSREIIGPDLAIAEVKDFCSARVPRMPVVDSLDAWQEHAARIRHDVLDKVIYRGEAVTWRDAATKVEWLDTIAGGEGYRIKKLRYEALPGLWIPALLYEPDNLTQPTAAVMNVNGHEPAGKATPYKQLRCINQAKRGMLALNVEWLGMGQLRIDEFMHYRMNQLDLCGTSGLAPFYLSMKRGLDVLLSHPLADPTRVAVAGLSGGGWQTIIISSLDTRVTLANPVAGYSSFLTRAHNYSDLGDSEQTPCDLATVADYTHLTALRAPRPTLLTYNIEDNCCFASPHALPPLLQAARPIFSIHGKASHLHSHVNHDPGTHNFDADNRQALYRMFAEYFYPADDNFPIHDIPCDAEVKTADTLAVEIPADNLNFQTLATKLSHDLPRHAEIPRSKQPFSTWRAEKLKRLASIVNSHPYDVVPTLSGESKQDGINARFWKLRLGETWTVPAVELSPATVTRTAIVVADGGRRQTLELVQPLLATGTRVVAVDPFYIGESKIKTLDFLFALLVSAVGERPVGLQASQLGAVARWLSIDRQLGPVTLVADGNRTGLAALVATALEGEAIESLELHNSLGSLKQVIERNDSVNVNPELFCFGLLHDFDIKQLAALSASRPVHFVTPDARVRLELSGLTPLYTMLGKPFDPLAP